MTGSESIKKGDKVTWKTPQGATEGQVTEKITSDEKVGGHTAKASTNDPQYKVKSDSSGKAAIHKPESLETK